MKKLLTLLLFLTMLLGIAAPAFAVSDNMTRYTELLSNYTWTLTHSSNSRTYHAKDLQLPDEYLILTEDATGQIYLTHTENFLLTGIVTFSGDEMTMVILVPNGNSVRLYDIFIYRRQ